MLKERLDNNNKTGMRSGNKIKKKVIDSPTRRLIEHKHLNSKVDVQKVQKEKHIIIYL